MFFASSDEICGRCIHLDEKNKKKYSSKDEYYCPEVCRYCQQTDRACRYFVKKFGCHIVTEVIKSLPYNPVINPQDHVVLKTYSDWRINTLEEDEKYSSLLQQYDYLGVEISRALKEDPLEPLMSVTLMRTYIVPITDMIRHGQDDVAVDKYCEMVMYLKNKYNIQDQRPIYRTNIDVIDNAPMILARKNDNE